MQFNCWINNLLLIMTLVHGLIHVLDFNNAKYTYWHWCWWLNDGYSLRCWWQNILLTKQCWWVLQCKEFDTNILNLSSTQIVSNITVTMDPLEFTFIPTQEKITGYLPMIYHKHNLLLTTVRPIWYTVYDIQYDTGLKRRQCR